MSYNSNTKTITAPVSVYDVQQALSTGDHDVGRLCVNTGINPWAKCKPINAPGIIRALDYSKAEQVTNYHCGLSVVYSTNNFNDFLAKVQASLNNASYKYLNEYTAVKYDRPTGTMLSPFRLSDYDGYRHNAELDASIPDESAGGDGLPISPVYSRNIQIDLRGTVTNKPLPDDSIKLAYYTNHMSGASQIAARYNLHILDIIHWQLNSGVVLTNLRRGILIMRQDSTGVYRWTSSTIPWASDPDWANAFGSSSGTPVWVVEFYTNVDYAGGTENKTGQFFCIPEFAYITTCITNASFAGTYPASNPYAEMIEIFYQCDAPISTFDELYLELQIYGESYGVGTWDPVTTVTVKNYSTVDVRGVYENLYRIDETIIGKKMRVRVYGKLAGSSNTTTFYYSEEVTITN